MRHHDCPDPPDFHAGRSVPGDAVAGSPQTGITIADHSQSERLPVRRSMAACLHAARLGIESWLAPENARQAWIDELYDPQRNAEN